MSRFNNVTFYTSVNDVRDLPLHTGIEIAFAGRSNAGKSSAINTITNRSRLAFVSKTPGRTQLINYFQLKTDHFFVDLPGYGYAKVPDPIRLHWQDLLSSYLQTRQALKGLVLIMDIRHPLKPLDIKMLDWFAPTGKAIHILLTKADKLSSQRASTTLKDVALYLNGAYPQCSVQLFSSLAATGVEEATAVISKWLA
ncbi:MAG: ribosome biogenesis GTP-binding protein YihA/YsxC [Nitrosomonas sp.]|jgi:GTP-binding protein|uniref:ribosome biogenesis GTP-binding protein YihA/YsxC n=1 Tax=Nitrosomonas sp. TaxID=42353 RepID=UPI0027266D46|nr:ribosome biogenesis GTP-binding protein YihA/YsxC [Nitrosomonas sp.]MDO8894098.1 ribosome biogenesis GTP-binding protein YihA/YsxC [Nitrosomonas sp.]MDO9469701.1 ribosome biogenesis GTP-binding protein YihA/YsxC [Nitrosomonas sp.]MDP1787336.1 ribosome biogenesis GTP-binding protein YihA/YsxC [Nitrosomonas sp.]MDP2223802.1 ribosome biogenesis GTP-binding protein YihA/YsxC [Nitrosomonas sp.]